MLQDAYFVAETAKAREVSDEPLIHSVYEYVAGGQRWRVGPAGQIRSALADSEFDLALGKVLNGLLPKP